MIAAVITVQDFGDDPAVWDGFTKGKPVFPGTPFYTTPKALKQETDAYHGVSFWGRYNKDCCTLGSRLGPPHKLPKNVLHCANFAATPP